MKQLTLAMNQLFGRASTPTYKVTVPPTDDQGSTTITVHDRAFMSKAEDALDQYNRMRAHDGQPPLRRMPTGTRYTCTGA